MAAPQSVNVRRESVVLPTYAPHPPDPNPMFLEKRVYQGSSGRVYPLPFVDRISEQPKPQEWNAVYLENEFVQVMILPELGGRIHRILDKTNGYDAIYHQPVIKPALVGLAGPWCSGGIEFNWPQHHRPSTFMPADLAIERGADGSVTVWLSEHDPMARLKGMHGICLYPGRSYVELRARVYNRTPDVQTFLWWANVATRVHEAYQSFFPPDVAHVADHAKRATTTFPRCEGHYYGVDYARRGRTGVPASDAPRQFAPPAPHAARDQAPLSAGSVAAVTTPAYAPDDLSWYANIPVPTSYMCVGSTGDFCGGYDYKAQAGLVHIANHHISPGKKQWTWGNQEFGYAWDRNLTDADEHGEFAPYIELMAGVYTDNQPDFSFLQPGETKTWRQHWYAIRAIGPVHQANVDAALSLNVSGRIARVGTITTSVVPNATVRVERRGKSVAEWTATLAPDQPFLRETKLAPRTPLTELVVRVIDAAGHELIAYTPHPTKPAATPAAATEPPLPAAVKSSDELYLIGLHLEQYRHATRHPEAYWREALRRDPGDARCNLALGRWHLRRGEFAAAAVRLRTSIARATSRNPNPADGEAYYQLGHCLRLHAFGATSLDVDQLSAAYAAFYKSTWNHAWQAAGFHALAEIDALRGHWPLALEHVDRALRVNVDNLRARNLRAIILRKLDRAAEASATLAETLHLDPLDWWARHLSGQPLTCDHQVLLDLALDLVRAGLFGDALRVLTGAASAPHGVDSRGTFSGSLGTAPLVEYYAAWIAELIGDRPTQRRHLARATAADPRYCFPARVEEIAILEHAIALRPRDARAPFFLGNLLYDRRRHREAISQWEQAARRDPRNAIAWRNLGIGYFNTLKRPTRARLAYERAFAANPRDARLLYERDQLWKRLGIAPQPRLRELQRHPQLVAARDDLSVELCALYNQTGRFEDARHVLTTRTFQPWEGGEGQALGQHVRTHLALGRQALRSADSAAAVTHFSAALAAPVNLGEANHLLANQSDVHFWLGCALAQSGHETAARREWTSAAEFKGDFQSMAVRSYSEKTYYSARSLERLGRAGQAKRLFRQLLAHGQALANAPANIDYFATSLPTMLLFDADLNARQNTVALFLQAQARFGLGERAAARRLLRTILRRDPNHALAADFLAETDFPNAHPNNSPR